MRHTFVTGLLYSGAEAVEAMGAAGQRYLSTTSRYTHEVTHKRASVVRGWAKALEAAGSDAGEASS